MARAFTPKIVTANALVEGDVIYMNSDGSWSRRHSEAKLFESESEANDALKAANTQTDFLVGAYLADAIIGKDGNPEPVHFREVFRTKGPSNYPDHGKQAEL